MRNILVLEDQPAVRDVMVEIIGEADLKANVECASSIGQARTLFKDRQWHGMVSDLALADGQSLDLIAELREQGVDIPVILVSGFLSSAKVRRAKELGVDEVLHKPFHPNALLESLNRVFGDVSGDMQKKCKQMSDDMHSKILPELFRMDRNIGIFFRMLNELPAHRDVASLCCIALSLAMDMVHAAYGFVALFERARDSLVMVAHQEAGEVNPEHVAIPDCRFGDTPFGPFLDGNEAFIQGLPGDKHGPACWPGAPARDYVAVPIRLQGAFMGVLCLMDCQSKNALSDQLKSMLGLLVTQLDTLLDNCAVHASLEQSMKETLIALVRALEARDKYTQNHTARVAKMAVRFADMLGLDEETITLVRTGALMHDIGKAGIPDGSLLKAGRLSDVEFATIKRHPEIGDSILKHMDTLARERQIVRYHHERIDGHGYPDQLKGDEIPFVARIVCVADCIDAMTTHRVYQQARPLSFVIEQLRKNSGTQFDTQVAEVAIKAIEEGHVNTQAASDDVDDVDTLPACFAGM